MKKKTLAEEKMYKILFSTSVFVSSKEREIKDWIRLSKAIRTAKIASNLSRYCIDDLWEYKAMVCSIDAIEYEGKDLNVDTKLYWRLLDVERLTCETLIARHYSEKQERYIRNAIIISSLSLLISFSSFLYSVSKQIINVKDPTNEIVLAK